MSSSNSAAGLGTQSFDLYTEITAQITDMLDKGVVPWRSPILGQSKAGFPKNLDSKKPYRGVNVFLLAFTAFAKGYGSSYWLSFNQAKDAGGTVRKGEKSTMVIFWKKYEVVDKQTGEKKQLPLLRYFRVFNVDQTEGIEAPDAVDYVPSEFKSVDAAEAIIKGYADGPKIEHVGQSAFYRPSTDSVAIPDPTRFTSSHEYFSTLFHELGHSTGAVKRLNRGLGEHLMPFGSPDYGKEELIAEMAASYLCGHAGIAPAVIENQAAYISGWLGRLKQDKKLIIQAAAAGQRAADWIRGQRFDVEGQGNGPDSTPESTRTNVPMVPNGVPDAPTTYASERKIPLTRAAHDYLRRGYAPVPIPAGQKGPTIKGWQHLRLTENQLDDAFAGAGNLGLLLGQASGNLVDVDLDCPEARELADRFLPPTRGVTGRPGSPHSHRWYICPDVQTVRRRDPVTRASIVELRGDGSQTLVGPSIHPSGEAYDFLLGEPAKVDSVTLIHAVDQLAAEVIRLRHGEIPAAAPAPRSLLSPAFNVDQTKIMDRAAAYLGAMPPAISGQAGHNAAYAAATALVHGFCLNEEEAFNLLVDQYNPRCQPPWSNRELLHKVTDAARQQHARQRGWLLSPV